METEIVNRKQNILDLDLADLSEVVSAYGQKAFRARQVFGWLAKGVSSFDEMTNVPASLRERLAEDYYIGLPEVIRLQNSKSDGTVKALFGLGGSNESGSTYRGSSSGHVAVESVFMKYEYGNSICISSQAGCRMGCRFCASTIGGLERDLTAGEMLAEVLAMRQVTGEDIGHVVIMGIGEPFDNYGEIAKFIRLINSPEGYGLGMRNITVSSCGIIPYIEKFGEDFPQVNLAISLHAPNQAKRSELMPVAKRYGYDELLGACRAYTNKTSRRITFEYAMIDGFNDSPGDAEELAGHLKGWLTHVNLIPLNKIDAESSAELGSGDVELDSGDADSGSGSGPLILNPSPRKRIETFKRVLEEEGVAVTIRRTLGADIDAACGQLRLK